MLVPLIIILTLGSFQGASDFDYDIQGNIYVVDRVGNMLVKLSPAGDSLRAVSGFGSGPLQFDEPHSVYARRGTDVYVADYNNHRIQRFNRMLDLIATITTRDDPDPAKRFGYPRDVALTRQGDILIVDGENRRVLKMDALAGVERSIGDMTAGTGRLLDPSLVEVDDDDNIYVADGSRVLRYDPFGSFTGLVYAARDSEQVCSISLDQNHLLVTTCPAKPRQFTWGRVIDLTMASPEREETFEGSPHVLRRAGDHYIGLLLNRLVVYAPEEPPTHHIPPRQ